MSIENGLGHEAEDLRGELNKKTLAEEYWQESQTREVSLKGVKNPELTRGEAFRFERGQILKAYKILRKEITDAEGLDKKTISKRDRSKEVEVGTVSKRELLGKLREKAREMEQKLDELEKQYYENVRTIEIETDFGKFSVPVAELDLRKKKGGDESEEKDEERISYFVLGSIATNYHQTAAFSMGLALEGQKVFVVPWPEQAMVGRPDNYAEILKQQQDLEMHKQYAQQLIRGVASGKNVNLLGHSMGGAVALEIGQDKQFSDEYIQDLVVIEPPCLEKKGRLALAKDFIFKELPHSEARMKIFKQGQREDTGSPKLVLEDGRILSQQHFDEKKLAKINPKGRYQLWAGTKSSVVDYKIAKTMFAEAEEQRIQAEPDANKLEMYFVQGATHDWSSLNNLGFSRMVVSGEKPNEQVTTVKKSDLERSVAEGMLKDIAKESLKN